MSIWSRDGDVLCALRDTPESPSSVPQSPATAVSLDALDVGSESPMGLDDTIDFHTATTDSELNELCSPIRAIAHGVTDSESFQRTISPVKRDSHPDADASDLERVAASTSSEHFATATGEPMWWKLTRHDVSLHVPAHWRDGLVACATEDDKYLITSPTVGYIPFPVIGTIHLDMMADCHFGNADPILHPQVLSDKTRFPWLAVVQIPMPHDKLLGIMWCALNRNTDFRVDSSNAAGLGTVCRTFLSYSDAARDYTARLVVAFERRYGHDRELRWLYDTMLDAVDRLDFPCTFRDMARQWACVQRYWAYTMAWIHWNVGFTERYVLDFRDYQRLPPECCMGCFTTSATFVAYLARLRIPVWFMRTFNELSGAEVIARNVRFDKWYCMMSFSDRAHYKEHEAMFAAKISSISLAGDSHLTWILQQSTQYSDREAVPVPTNNFPRSDSLTVSLLPTPPVVPEAIDAARPNNHPTSDNLVSSPTQIQSVASAATGSARHIHSAKQKFHPFSKHSSTKKASTSSATKRPVAATKKRLAKLGKHELSKFDDWTHDLAPPSLPLWQTALTGVDTSRPTAKNEAVWKYWFPDPKLIFGCTKPHRFLRYLQNWLRVREMWLFLVGRGATEGVRARPLRNQEWRDFLNGSRELPLGPDFDLQHSNITPPISLGDLDRKALPKDTTGVKIPAAWFGRSLSAMTNAEALPVDEYDCCTVRLVAWELHEIAFRYELAELHAFLVPLPPSDSIAIRERQHLISAVFQPVQDIIGRGSCGLTSVEPTDKAPFLDAFLSLVSQWPAGRKLMQSGVSFASTSSPIMFDNMERILLSFYCQSFFETCGRPPVLPRQFPSSNLDSESRSAAPSSSNTH